MGVPVREVTHTLSESAFVQDDLRGLHGRVNKALRRLFNLSRGSRLLAEAIRRLRRGAWGRGRLCCDGGRRRCRLRLPWGRPRACRGLSGAARRGFLRAAFRCGGGGGGGGCGASEFG